MPAICFFSPKFTWMESNSSNTSRKQPAPRLSDRALSVVAEMPSNSPLSSFDLPQQPALRDNPSFTLNRHHQRVVPQFAAPVVQGGSMNLLETFDSTARKLAGSLLPTTHVRACTAHLRSAELGFQDALSPARFPYLHRSRFGSADSGAELSLPLGDRMQPPG
jgi:hypothetical protein